MYRAFSGLTSPVEAGTIGRIKVQVSVATDEKGIRLYSGTGPPLYPGTNSAGLPLLPSRKREGAEGGRSGSQKTCLNSKTPTFLAIKAGDTTPAVNKGHPGSRFFDSGFFYFGPGNMREYQAAWYRRLIASIPP